MSPKNQFVMQASFYAHRALMRDTELLNNIANRIDQLSKEQITQLRKWYQFYWNMMEQHHQAEDDIMFVEIEKRLNQPSELIEAMEVEHTRLQFLIDEIKRLLGEAERAQQLPDELKKKLSSFTSELLTLFTSHINKEEKYVFESMTSHFSPREQTKIENRVKRRAPINYIRFMIPWLHDSLSEDEKKLFDQSLPWRVKLLNSFFGKNKYRQLTLPLRQMV